MVGDEVAEVTPPSPGGPGVRLGEGLGVRASYNRGLDTCGFPRTPNLNGQAAASAA